MSLTTTSSPMGRLSCCFRYRAFGCCCGAGRLGRSASAVLAAYIALGAGRVLAAKIFYDRVSADPFYVTLLSTLGCASALPAFLVASNWDRVSSICCFCFPENDEKKRRRLSLVASVLSATPATTSATVAAGGCGVEDVVPPPGRDESEEERIVAESVRRHTLRWKDVEKDGGGEREGGGDSLSNNGGRGHPAGSVRYGPATAPRRKKKNERRSTSSNISCNDGNNGQNHDRCSLQDGAANATDPCAGSEDAVDEAFDDEDNCGSSSHGNNGEDAVGNNFDDEEKSCTGSRTNNDESIRKKKKKVIGSMTGVSEETAEAARWSHRIPWWAKPIVPAWLGMLSSILYYAALVYLSPSMLEIMYTGLGMVASFLCARFVRKRRFPSSRWIALLVVVVGIVVVGLGARMDEFFRPTTALEGEENVEGESGQSDGDDGLHRESLGIVLLVLAIVLSTFNNFSTEVFLQECDFPALLLIGMSGLYGFLFGLVLYVAFGPMLGYSPSETIRTVSSSPDGVWFSFVLLVVESSVIMVQTVLTGLTSSTTRNTWKVFRGLAVWLLGLAIYYGSGGEGSTEVGKDFGEKWTNPNSYVIASGYVILIVGVIVYYRDAGKTPPSSSSSPKGRVDAEGDACTTEPS
ncbi:hypothetical protein ACHAWF_016660 [Thalassiosira exigua]